MFRKEVIMNVIMNYTLAVLEQSNFYKLESCFLGIKCKTDITCYMNYQQQNFLSKLKIQVVLFVIKSMD